MRKKIVGIFVCTLLISAAVLPVLGMINNKTLKEKASNNYSKMEDSYAGCFSPGWSYITHLPNTVPDDNESFGSSVSVSGCYAIVGCPGDYSPMWFAGSAYIYERNPSTGWSLTPDPINGIISADDADFEDFFGWSVSIDGDTAIVGAPWKDSGAFEDVGAAYIFERDPVNGIWGETVKLLPSTPYANYISFGCSVSIDGDYAVVGAYGDSAFTGAAYVFDASGAGGWSTASRTRLSILGTPGDSIGRSVSIDGDYIVVGAPDFATSTGIAYVFKKTVAGWIRITMLGDPFGGTSYDRFGYSVSIDGDYMVVGAPGDDYDTGVAYVFDKSSGWGYVATLTSSVTWGDYFGWSVSINGDYAVVGAPGCNAYTGEAYLFQRTGAGWSLVLGGPLTLPAGGSPEDYFGGAVGIDHCSVIIGAPGYRGSWYYEGIVYVFESDDVFLDLIIQDNVINPGTITPIGNDTYEPTYLAPGLKQIGSWTAYYNLGFHIYSCEIVLENDCFTTLNYIIMAQFLLGSPTPFFSFLRYIDTSASWNHFAISATPNIGFGVLHPCSSTLLRILIFTIIHGPGSGIQVGVNVMSTFPSFTSDSVIFHN